MPDQKSQTAPPPRKPLTEWQPIETAPKDGTWVIACDDKGAVRPDYWIGSDICQWAKKPHSSSNLFWMPLPDPPAAHGIKENT